MLIYNNMSIHFNKNIYFEIIIIIYLLFFI